MSRFGDSANGPSVLDISNISGVSADIDTLADHATAISNLGPVATQIGNLGTTAVIADMSALGTQAVRDDMDALADVTTELGVLGNATTAGYIAAIGTSTVGSTSQLTVDALGQLSSEISLLAGNITTLQNSASNSPIQLANLSDVDFGGSTPTVGQTIVYVAGSTNKFQLAALPGAGPLSGTNFTDSSAAAGHLITVQSLDSNGDPVYNTDTTENIVRPAISATGDISYDTNSGQISFNNSSNYLTSYTETNDLTAAVTWADVPDGNITQSSVTQHVSNLATSANFADINEAGTSGTAGDVIHWSGSAWTKGQLASAELSDGSAIVLNNANTTLTGNYTVDGNLDVTNGEIRVDTIDPDPHGNGGTLTILGNLQVDGTTTTINSATLAVNDKSVTLSKPASGNTTSAAMNGAGIDVDTTGMSAVWTTNAPAITYSTNSSGNAADAQTWDINRGVVAKGWSDGTSSYDGQLTINCSANSHGVTIEGPQHASGFTDYTLKLPDTAPTAGQMLVASSSYATDAKLEFVDQSGGGASTGFAIAMSIVF